MKAGNQMLINAHSISINQGGEYEFILDKRLDVLRSMDINTGDSYTKLDSDVLFELNHIRVNPALNNHDILQKLINKLIKAGINVYYPHGAKFNLANSDHAGSLNSVVRFHIKEGKVVFLSPSKPRLSSCL